MALLPGKCRVMTDHDPETGEIREARKANVAEFTVSEISFALKRTLEDSFGHVRVRGEISGFRGPHSSGHCYFSSEGPRGAHRRGDLAQHVRAA